MTDHYFRCYFLSFFKPDKTIRLSQLLHVFRGKRTPSMYYITEINQWHHGFALLKNLELETLEKLTRHLLQEQLLQANEDGYILTEKGKARLLAFFEEHYYPQAITSFTHLNLRELFWERLQLYIQVFSEFSHHNRQYIPVVKHPSHQENVRQLFQQVGSNRELVSSQWQKEQLRLLENLPALDADVLANFMTGHQVLGKTRKQVADSQNMGGIEFRFYFTDVLERMIQTIKSLKNELPLLFEILQQVDNATSRGLSASTFQTYKMLTGGQSIDEISFQRRIKANTVKEHILEMAFTLADFPSERFVPSEIYYLLQTKFAKDPEYSYQKAKKDLTELEFYHYRLVELERLRAE